LIADITDGSNQFTLFTDPSNHNSQKNREFFIISWLLILFSYMSNNIATVIGRSKLVQIFFMSLGARFNIIFLLGRSIHILRNVALILSFDSLMAVSGSQIISILGRDLFESASTIISNHCNHKFVNVLIFWIIIYDERVKYDIQSFR
jgi:hypothetical protein